MVKKRRKLRKKGRLIFIILLCGVLGYFSFDYFYHKNDVEVTPEEPVVEEEKIVELDFDASLFMVGDALIHSSVYEDARQEDGTYNFVPMLAAIKPTSSKYDLAYYNQETVLGGTEIGLSNYPRFNSPYEVGDAFIDAGFNMVSLATNHTMDRGEIGVLNSVQYWKSKGDLIAASGQWSSYEERSESVAKVYSVNGINYAFISYTIWNNGLSTPYDKDYLNNEYSPEKAALDIASVRDKVDFVIVAMHWGTEYSFRVDYKQEEIAQYLSSLGVDLIIGAHPHVVQTAEYINDGKTFVIYSLGNFISDQNDVDNFTGLAFEVTLHKHVDLEGNVTHSVINPKAELIYTTTSMRRGVNHDFKVVFYPQLNDSLLRNYLGYYDEYRTVVNERFPDLVWGLTWE